jgi:hypothetical protein
MSFGTFGQILPLQVATVKLAMIDPALVPQPGSDEELQEQVSNGRQGLVHRTGVDFGYELLACTDP